jgi:hypothetical protein
VALPGDESPVGIALGVIVTHPQMIEPRTSDKTIQGIHKEYYDYD